MSKRFDIHEWQAKQRLSEENNPVVAKGDGLEITQDEMEKLHKNGRVKLKNGSVLVYMKDLNEALNPEVSQKVNAFIKAMAKRYDYSEQDAVFAIMAALKQRKTDEASTTGTGASFTPGTGAAYATPRAFGDNKRKKKKGYMGYKEI